MPEFTEEVFSYRVLKGERVQLCYQKRAVETLTGKAAGKFLLQVEGASSEQAQLLMAKETKNFKRGNERQAKLSS